MLGSFRASMGWFHTWIGLVLGAVLFAIFWMGSLSVYDREIDQWMMPATRLPRSSGAAILAAIGPALEAVPAGVPRVFLALPTDRTPAITLDWQAADGAFQTRYADPATGHLLPDAGTLGASGFFYPFHISLNLALWDIGEWIVGLAAMAMLALVVSGVVVHVRIIKDFFLLRTGRKPQRTLLDLHNVAGVVGLPFHVMMSFTGLVIFMSIYLPPAWQPLFRGEAGAYVREAYGSLSRPAAGIAGTQAPVAAMAAEAVRLWSGRPAAFISISNPGDLAAVVEVDRDSAQSVATNRDMVFFDGHTGAVLGRHAASPVMDVQQALSGLHLVRFRHWTLRALYFVMGMLSCVTIATGFLFWIESRRKRLAALGAPGLRLVEGLAAGAITGMVLATAAFLAANRLLPAGMPNRAMSEEALFYTAWVACFAHGWVRRAAAWREQCWAIAGLLAAAVILNAATTGDHPVQALLKGDGAVAGVDLGMMAAAAVAVAAARSLSRRSRTSGLAVAQ